MISAASLLTLLTFSITGLTVEVRNSLVTLPMTRRLKLSNGTSNILQHDEDRLAAFGDNIQPTHVPLANAEWNYIVAVNIGSPPTTYNLIVDTGSSNTWVGAGTPYVGTRTSVNTRRYVALQYGSAYFEGVLWTDTVSLANALTINTMPFGVAYRWGGINWDGILGIGPTALTLGSLPNSQARTIPTITDCLYTQGRIPKPIVGMFFQPAARDADDDGELTFGGADRAMYTGEIAYTDITPIPRSSSHWGIDQRITYGAMEILSTTSGIVDSGCVFVYIPTYAYQRYQAATGAAVSQANDLLQISLEQYDALDNLKFHIGYETYSLNPNAQIWPRFLNSKLNGDKNAIYLIVKDMGERVALGFNFINGYVFLQRFYTVFDTEESRIGFAETLFTYATTN